MLGGGEGVATGKIEIEYSVIFIDLPFYKVCIARNIRKRISLPIFMNILPIIQSYQ